MTAAEASAIVAALVTLVAAIATAAVQIINALRGHGTIVAANTEAVNASTAALNTPVPPAPPAPPANPAG